MINTMIDQRKEAKEILDKERRCAWNMLYTARPLERVYADMRKYDKRYQNSYKIPMKLRIWNIVM